METINPYAAPREASGMQTPPQVPTSIAEIFVTSASLFATNALAVLGTSLLIWLPFELLRAYYLYFVADPEDPIGSSFWLENLVAIWPFGGVMAIGHAAMKGERPSAWFGVRAGLQNWMPLLGTRIIVGLLTILALFAFILPGFYVAARALLAEPVTIAERASGMPGMKRSFALTEGLLWRHLLLLFVVFAVMFFVGAIAAAPLIVSPGMDHWLITVAINTLVDVAMSWPALLYVAAYWAAARPVVEERGMEDEVSGDTAS